MIEDRSRVTDIYPSTVEITAEPRTSPQHPDRYVAAQLDRLRLAMLAGDKATPDNLMADELTYGPSDRRVMNKADIVDAIATGRSRFNWITVSEQTIRIVGDLAIVRHRFEADAVSNGKPGHPDIRIIQVWQRRPAGWELLVRQAH